MTWMRAARRCVLKPGAIGVIFPKCGIHGNGKLDSFRLPLEYNPLKDVKFITGL